MHHLTENIAFQLSVAKISAKKHELHIYWRCNEGDELEICKLY